MTHTNPPVALPDSVELREDILRIQRNQQVCTRKMRGELCEQCEMRVQYAADKIMEALQATHERAVREEVVKLLPREKKLKSWLIPNETQTWRRGYNQALQDVKAALEL